MKINEQGVVEMQTADVVDTIGIILRIKNHFRVPRNKRDKVGIVIAIRTTSAVDRERLETDYISEIKRYLKESSPDDNFWVIEYPQHLSKRINDAEIAKKYLYKSKAHLIVYGVLSKGKIEGDNNYVFKLRGLVRHSPIPELMRKQFSVEFGELLPGRMVFPENQEVLGFELAEKYLKYAIKYIIAIAAFVSGDLNLSEKLNIGLSRDIDRVSGYVDFPILREIKKRIPARITEIMSTYLILHYNLFSTTRDVQYIQVCKRYLDIIAQTDPDNYCAHLSRSIYYFFNKEIDKAILELKNISSADPTWRLNLGFLKAYKGDINGALAEYKKTFYAPAYSNVYNDADIFISEVLAAEPEKVQLYFFRGLINLKLKADYKSAKADFLLFMATKKKEGLQKLERLSLKYLSGNHLNKV